MQSTCGYRSRESGGDHRLVARFTRFTAGVVTAVLAGLLVAVVLYHTSVQPGARIVRAVFERNALVTPPPGFAETTRDVTHERVSVPGGGALDIYTPSSPAQRPIVLWVHGGGFISSSPATVADYTVLLAHAGYTVASLDYSLAPGAKYPAPIREGNAALQLLRAQAGRFGGDPARIVLGGDSAGAQIAAQLAAVQTDPALARSMGLTASGALRGVVLYCGLYDMRTVGGTGFPALRTYLWAYTGSRNWTAYPDIDQLSVTKHVTAAYPATFLSVGDADPFAAQAAELATVLQRQSVPLTTVFWNGTGDHLGHEYQFDFGLPQARTAFQRTLAFLTTTTGR